MVGAITNVTMMRSKLPLKCSFDVKKESLVLNKMKGGKWAKEEVFFFENLLVSFSFFWLRSINGRLLSLDAQVSFTIVMFELEVG